MKFTYGEKQYRGECVAFIHSSGCLIIKSEEPEKDDYCQVIGGNSNEGQEWWDSWIKAATRKFYPGDKITITF